MKFKSVKARILIAFFVYATISLVVSITSFLLFQDMEDVDHASSAVNRIYNRTLNALRIGQEFFVYETHNQRFFMTGESEILEDHQRMLREIIREANGLGSLKGSHKLRVNNELDELLQLLNDYELLFEQIIMKVRERGFKDYGLIGNMRSNIHTVENSPHVDPTKVLMLRRHEKDYLLRNDTTYMFRIMELTGELRTEILDQQNISAEQKSTIINALNHYHANFMQIVNVDYDIGYRNQTGKINRLKDSVRGINQLVRQITKKANDAQFNIMTRIQVVLVIVVTLSVILTLFLSISFKFILEEDKEITSL